MPTNLTYQQKDTALLISARSSLVQPTKGDPFVAVWDYTTDSEYNSMVDNYLAMVADIEAVFQWNRDHPGGTQYTVTGRDENGNNYPITDAPSDPFPIPPKK